MKIIAINLRCLAINAESYFMEYNDFDSLRSILKYMLFDYFSIKNKEVSQYKGSNIIPSLSYIHQCIGGTLEELNNGLKKCLKNF